MVFHLNMKTKITIQGTHCNACKALIEDVCKDIPGVQSCSVDFQTGETEIEHADNFDWQKLKQEIEDLGQYKLELNK